MKKVLLSFDIEEFDMPLEYGKELPFGEQLSISQAGCQRILALLKQYDARATFFSTVIFAKHSPDIIAAIRTGYHELASHGYFHSKFDNAHLLESRIELERLSGLPVNGFRMPRMMPVDDRAIEQAGYHYNSSINPVWLPGRYDHRDKPRTVFRNGKVWQLPASATPALRVPLFWLSFHNLPLSVYKKGCKNTIMYDQYLNLYFHPWEFTDLSAPRLGMPWYVRRNSGTSMEDRFGRLLDWMKNKGYQFSTITNFLDQAQKR